ncbi:dihydroneopterin aldolase [Thioalkalivibrio paradoxus]|uniref:7,8-dihydroneopterin aldolase n=1 Tax=Thioalkalivibrio paradoxus ARh 1 TaxID=713585 RepID=W0DR26_9GAMM|nr:dihydroneopterin aldolase [Thioalkalivibrio paradoxus]AHE99453.1 dihydroneopterin triphosphate 2'-epimerase [Thioalkalivibrio paradoxus ARh 1]
MDHIYLRDLEVEAVIGVYPWEQRVRRRLRFDIELGADTRVAARSGDIADTVDYEAVANCIRAIASREPHVLLEGLAEEIAETLLRRFGGHSVRLTVGKPGAVAGAREVGIVIERGHP